MRLTAAHRVQVDGTFVVTPAMEGLEPGGPLTEPIMTMVGHVLAAAMTPLVIEAGGTITRWPATITPCHTGDVRVACGSPAIARELRRLFLERNVIGTVEYTCAVIGDGTLPEKTVATRPTPPMPKVTRVPPVAA